MSFPRYPAYKPSGVEWLGEVPEHWEITQLKWQTCRNDGGVWGLDPDDESTDTIVLRSTEQTVDGKWQLDEPATRRLSPSEKASSVLTKGDLVITKSSGSSAHIGKTTIVTDEIAELNCCYSNFMQRLRLAPSLNPMLAWHALNNRLFREQFDFLSNSTTGLANLNGTMIGQVLIPLAPRAEQDAIATFLTRETTKIDALIAEQQRLIELLQEKRQAVISHAVTKGLNPDAPMKDSGVEWLGEVPEHWEVLPIKHTCSLLRDGTHLPPARVAEGIPLLSVRNIQGHAFGLRNDDSLISEQDYLELSRSFVPEPDDVMLAIVGATMGKAAIVPSCIGRFHIQRSLAIFRSKPELLVAKWLLGVIGSIGFNSLLWQNVGFSAQPGIYLGVLKDIRIPVPPKKEQEEILARLDESINDQSQILSVASHSVDLLQERRSALISAAVTGQIDVRGLVPEAEAV